MLRHLLRKDWILNRRILLLCAAMFGVFVVLLACEAAVPPGEFLAVSGLLFSFTPVTILGREDKFGSSALFCALPVTRRRIVGARYFLGLCAGVAGLALAMLCALVLPVSVFTASDLVAPGILLGGVASLVIAQSLLIPFTIRFGLLGIIVFLGAVQVAGLAAFLLARVVGASGLRSLAAALAAALATTRGALGDAGYVSVWLAALAVLFFVSFRLSARILERRDL